MSEIEIIGGVLDVIAAILLVRAILCLPHWMSALRPPTAPWNSSAGRKNQNSALRVPIIVLLKFIGATAESLRTQTSDHLSVGAAAFLRQYS